MKPEDILTPGEVAELCEVSLLTVRTWTHRHADFPKPWKTGRQGEPNLYLRADILRWLADTGRKVPANRTEK